MAFLLQNLKLRSRGNLENILNYNEADKFKIKEKEKQKQKFSTAILKISVII